MTTDIQLIQYPHQLSEAAGDPVKLWAEWAVWGFQFYDGPGEDYGLETFSTDTLEGGLPDD